MILFLALTDLIFATAIVILFAMLGQLWARIEAREVSSSSARPLQGAKLGALTHSWPAQLTAGRDDASVRSLVVLSATCTTCQQIGRDLRSTQPPRDYISGVVVTGPRQREIEEFMADFGPFPVPTVPDASGDWVTGEFGVNSSPSLLLFEDMRLVEAYTFNHLDAIPPLLRNDRRVS